MLSWIDSEIESVVRRIQRDARQLCLRLSQDRDDAIADEDDFTSEFAAAIRKSLDGKSTGGISWKVTPRKLTSKGPRSEEAIFGADMGIVFSLETDELSYKKGVLVQAKREHYETRDGLSSISSPERARLAEQCEDMLAISSESFVWVYRSRGLEVYSANSIVGRSPKGMAGLKPSKIGAFFRDALKCKTGDHDMVSSKRNMLQQLLEERRLKSTLELAGHGDRPPSAVRLRG